MRAAIITPVESPAAYLARFTDDGDLPRYSGGSAPTLALSRPSQCSLTLRPARSADPLRGLSIEVLQIIRRLLIRSDRFRLEREFAGPDFHRGERCALPRHTEQSSREFASADATAGAQDAAVQESGFSPEIPLDPCGRWLSDARMHSLGSSPRAWFGRADSGGRHWAIVATLIQTAKLNDVDPLAWLTDVLERIVAGRTKRNNLASLLPWNWKAAKAAEAPSSA